MDFALGTGIPVFQRNLIGMGMKTIYGTVDLFRYLLY